MNKYGLFDGEIFLFHRRPTIKCQTNPNKRCEKVCLSRSRIPQRTYYIYFMFSLRLDHEIRIQFFFSFRRAGADLYTTYKLYETKYEGETTAEKFARTLIFTKFSVFFFLLTQKSNFYSRDNFNK